MLSNPNHLTAVQWATGAKRLVEMDDEEDIRQLEALLGCTQEEAVNHFIEGSCCGEDLPEFCDGKGTPQARLMALRALWRSYEG